MPGLAISAVVFLLVAISMGSLLVAIVYPQLVRRREAAMRLDAIAAPRPTGDRDGGASKSRKRPVFETLREFEQRRAVGVRHVRPSLKTRIQQAGLKWPKPVFYGVSAAVGIVSALIALLFARLPLPIAVGLGIVAGLLLPQMFLTLRRKAQLKRFTAEFPNAVDVIVRGVKAGLPLAECLRIIAAEAQDPVKREFRTILEEQTLGLPLDKALQRLPERMPVQEASFFSIVIAIQSRTGGNLSEALGNLSKVLRERKKMRAKIKAMSSEAKASAIIIGSLPFIVAGLVYMTSPEYISLLYETTAGNVILAVSAAWMLAGMFIMRKMIRFDF